MATVYLARDERHDRRVAVKVLRPELSLELGADRFVREIHLAARLNHPHIMPLFDSGEAGGFLYYVMPVVEGESLRERLQQAKRLPVEDATQIAQEVADALDYAHRHGVVHRDIKPENILLQDGHAVVADFGIGKAVSAAAQGVAALTRTGVTVGTPAYMSPEQAAGEEVIDGRTDLYSRGCVLYEMLAGAPPFTGPTAQAVIAAHLAATPQPLAELRPDTPPSVADAIARALAKDPNARFRAATAFRDAIGPPATAAAPRQAHPLRVAGLYGLAAALVLGVAYLLVIQLGLPSWVISGAVVLLLVGLPIVVATGLVERRRAVARAIGVPAAVGLSRWLTWQRTLAGESLAFFALGVGAAGYMAMRLLGIGPVGTLVASGVLKNREPLILADFENRAPDSTLGLSLTAAFRVDLSESPAVRLMDGAAIAAALRRMERPATTPLDPGLAREIAQRENVKAVVRGEIDPLGRGYVLSASLIAAADGHVLTALRETADNDAALIGAVDRLSRKLRERIGESLKSIRRPAARAGDDRVARRPAEVQRGSPRRARRRLGARRRGLPGREGAGYRVRDGLVEARRHAVRQSGVRQRLRRGHDGSVPASRSVTGDRTLSRHRPLLRVLRAGGRRLAQGHLGLPLRARAGPGQYHRPERSVAGVVRGATVSGSGDARGSRHGPGPEDRSVH